MRLLAYGMALGFLAALSALRLAGLQGPSVGVILAALWMGVVARLRLHFFLALAAAIPPALGLLVLGPNPWEADFLVASAGALTALLVFAIAPESRKGPLALLASGLLMWLLALLRFSPPPLTTLGALALALGLGWAARWKELLEDTGLISGALLGLLVIVFAESVTPGSGARWFIYLLAFFILGAAFTKFRHAIKASRGVAQKRRDFRNVLANGLGPVAMAAAFALYGPPFDAAFLGAVATVTADTMATEVGMTQRRHPRLIHNLKVVPPGTSGAVSPLGEASAAATCLVMGALALGLGLAVPAGVAAPVIGGLVGVHVDSLIGALLERRWRLSNHTVNFLASLAGGAAAMAVALR